MQILQGLLTFVTEDLCFLGSSIAQNRGQLEAQSESLRKENESLRKASERDNDTLRIKCKIIEDQTETIGKLKEVTLAFYFGKRVYGRFESICIHKFSKYPISICLNEPQLLTLKVLYDCCLLN